jgi:hypothetical protein
MKYHHGGIQSPISTQSTPPPQFGPPPPRFGPQCPCPCPGPGIHGMPGPCGLASATPAPSPRAVKPTTPVVAATATISLRFIMHPWCNHLPPRCSSSPTRITRGSPPTHPGSRHPRRRMHQPPAVLAAYSLPSPPQPQSEVNGNRTERYCQEEQSHPRRRGVFQHREEALQGCQRIAQKSEDCDCNRHPKGLNCTPDCAVFAGVVGGFRWPTFSISDPLFEVVLLHQRMIPPRESM